MTTFHELVLQGRNGEPPPTVHNFIPPDYVHRSVNYRNLLGFLLALFTTTKSWISALDS
jgi:hypothetical protein